jgi:GNAT superfamily N-acetyltransferase
LILRPATCDDVCTYVAFAVAAQDRLRERGLGQYVPAAHPEYAASIRCRVADGSLFKACSDGESTAFFSLEEARSPWWPADGVPALYLAGMVVSPVWKGRGVGGVVIDWCAGQARRRGCRAVRLDCHAGNPWLCRYYESHGFRLQGRIEQHPGYVGCLYQRDVATGNEGS